MRKTILLAALAAAFTLASCQKNEITEAPAQIQFDFTVELADFDGATKAIKTGWANGDKVYVYFDSHFASADDLMTMTYNNGSWDIVSGSNVSTNLQSSGTLCAIYTTETPTITYDEYNIYFAGSNYGTCGFFTAESVDYTYADSKVTATIALGIDTELMTNQITVTGLSGDGWYLQELSGETDYYSSLNVRGNSYGLSIKDSNGWGGKLYLNSNGETYITVNPWVQSARDRTFILSNGTVGYQKTFSSKGMSYGNAMKFAGPNDADSPTNGWQKLSYFSVTIPGSLTGNDF